MQHLRTEPYAERLRALLPPGWRVDLARPSASISDTGADALITIEAPDESRACLLGLLRSRISAREAATLGARLEKALTSSASDGAILFTRFTSTMARTRLRDAGLSYLDSTGNAWIVVSRPSLVIERQGAELDPDPPRRDVKSLRGAKAGRIVRGLCDWLPPVGVRELARRTETNPGYVTRVLSLLEDEDVIKRGDRGEVADVRWRDLLGLWSRDYSMLESNRAVRYLAPRGMDRFRSQLGDVEAASYAVTGSFAVPLEARVAPGQTVVCYVASPETTARTLDLRESDTGANVVLLEPFDRVVFERTRTIDDLTVVALSQCAVDLLTGTGREPAQGEALIAWMEENEDGWRG